MNTQEKFQVAMQKIADARDLDLVIEHNYANTGYHSLQPRGGFELVLRFPFNFQTGYSSCHLGAEPGPLGRNRRGRPWGQVQGGEHDQVLARVAAALDGESDAVRIVVLPDGETDGLLLGSRVYEVPPGFEAQQIGDAPAEGSLDGSDLR